MLIGFIVFLRFADPEGKRTFISSAAGGNLRAGRWEGMNERGVPARCALTEKS